MKVTVEKPGSPEEILEEVRHFGKKGMKWGVRNKTRSGGGGSTARSKQSKLRRTGRAAGGIAKALGRGADNVIFEVNKTSDRTNHHIVNKATTALRKDLPGIKAKHGAYGKLRNRAKHPFSPEAKAYRSDVKKSYLKHLEKSANSVTNLQGTRQYTLKESGKPNTKQYLWKVQTQSVKHIAADGSFTVRPIFDDEGFIINIELVDDEMAQTMDLGSDFLVHMGLEI